jgi:hypothetical protein
MNMYAKPARRTLTRWGACNLQVACVKDAEPLQFEVVLDNTGERLHAQLDAAKRLVRHLSDMEVLVIVSKIGSWLAAPQH